MFVFSQAQFQRLLGIPPDWTAESLLDLGNTINNNNNNDKYLQGAV